MDVKHCTKCKTDKAFSEFNKNAGKKFGLSIWCKACTKNYYLENRERLLKKKREHYITNIDQYDAKNRKNYEKHYKAKMLYSAKRRAKLAGVPFFLKAKDFQIPKTCPVLGIKLQMNVKYSKYNSPSLDKVIPSRGYVAGNVIVISLKANQIKNCASVEELERVYNFYKNWEEKK